MTNKKKIKTLKATNQGLNYLKKNLNAEYILYYTTSS